MSSRCLVIGIDGFDPDYFEANRADLPTLNSLARGGMWGRLRSTFPPVTGPAWTSAFTGVNPGVHGITSFAAYDDDMRRTVFDARAVRVPRIWNYLSDVGMRVAVVGVPLTWPVEVINGVMVSGFMTPEGAKQFAYPMPWQERLDGAGYVPDLGLALDAPERQYLAALYESSGVKYEQTLAILESEAWDCFIVVVSESDWIQHYLSRPDAHPDQSRNDQLILDYFRYLDTYVSRWLDAAGQETSVLVCSDHGFGHFAMQQVSVNRYLVDAGLARVAPGHAAESRSQSQWVRFRRRMRGLHRRHMPSRVDRERSRAWFRQQFWIVGGVYFNRRLRPDRIKQDDDVSDLIQNLRALKDETTGRAIFAAVERRDEWLWGPHAAHEPDILCWMANGYGAVDDLRDTLVGAKDGPSNSKGGHRPLGIWIADGFESLSTSQTLRVEAIAGLVLTRTTAHLAPHRVELPEFAVGSIVEALKHVRDVTGERSTRQFVVEDDFPQEATAALARRLRALGYLADDHPERPESLP